MSEDSPKMRRIVPYTPPLQQPTIVLSSKPDLGALLEDALSIYQTEILKLKKISNQIGNLSPSQANVLQGYVKSLVGAAVEMRKRKEEAEAAVESMSQDELLTQMEAETAALRARLKGAK